MRSEHSMYEELAPWWPLLSAPAEYEEEASYYLSVLGRYGTAPQTSLLELGSGGGNNASWMKKAFETVTLVDLAPGMLDVSRDLNPDCGHVQGDMRSVRLGRTFDCVFVHDAIAYMTTLDDLRRVFETARVHCRPGGIAVFAPDFVRENFRPGTDHGGSDDDTGRGLRYLEWVWDPDPTDSTYVADYGLLARDSDGETRMLHDRHVEGLFSLDDWIGLLDEAGFRAQALRYTHPDVDYEMVVFVGIAM